ncbi:LCP family protein [Pedococcus sp. NPDC057267]|uniref:LCP family protein n=1 Tax=Pedococcus sp. NPDC057267 TaxID=3346077 RepID=UPI00362C72D6
MPRSPLTRRSVLLGVAAAASSLVAACSKAKPRQAPTTSSSSTTTTKPPAPQVTGTGIPADLLAVMTRLYHGGPVAASPGVAAPLAARAPLTGSVATAGSVGTWGKTPIAVVTFDRDATLLVKEGGWRVVGGWWPSMKVAAQPAGLRRVLVVGSDARPGEDPRRARGDSLHIVAFDGKGSGAVGGIPRDSWVPLSVGGVGKINSALSLGGPDALQRTVTSVTGVPLEGYVLTGFSGFQSAVDAVGGLRFDAPVTVIGTLGDTLVRKGPNMLDGFRALNFARDRHTVVGGDFGRSANQGLIMLAGATMLRVAGPRSLPGYLTRIGPHVITNLSAEKVLTLSSMAFRTPAAAFRSQVAPGRAGMQGAQSVVFLAPEASKMFAGLRGGRFG